MFVKGGSHSDDIIQYEKLKSQYAADEIYNAERVGSALKDDPTHRAASYLSKDQLANGRTHSFTGGDNKSYTLLQTKGQLDGDFLHIVAGAAIGAVVSGGISYVSQSIKNKSFTKGINWRQVAGNAVEGAVTGGIGAATGGASLAASAATSAAKTGVKTVVKSAAKKVAVNVAANFAGNAANQLISKDAKDFSVKEAAIAGATGIIDVAGDAGSAVIKKTGSKVVSKVAGAVEKKAGTLVAQKAGAKAAQKALDSSAAAGIVSTGVDIVQQKAVSAKAVVKKLSKEGIESGTTSKPNQVHHYATNKSKTYTPQLEEITNKYGLDLDDAWNKDLLPHQGRHPNAYHNYVLDSMKQFDDIAQGDKDVFLKLYDNLKNNVKTNPDMLYKDYWK